MQLVIVPVSSSNVLKTTIWIIFWVNKRSDIFTKTQTLGIIDRFQVSIPWILNQKKWYKRNCPPWKWNFKNSICVTQFRHVCSVLKSYPASWHRHWKCERPQIEFLKFHFEGGQFLLYHFFWLRIHDIILTWKRSIIPNFWVLVKISLFLLTQNIIQSLKSLLAQLRVTSQISR